jgi:hypothetical protein
MSAECDAERSAAAAATAAAQAELEAARAEARSARALCQRAEAALSSREASDRTARAALERKLKAATRAVAEEATLSAGLRDNLSMLSAELARYDASERATRGALQQLVSKHEELSKAYGAMMALKPTVEALTDYLSAHFAGFEKAARTREAATIVTFCADWLRSYRSGEMSRFVSGRVNKAMACEYDKAVRNTTACGATPPTRAEFNALVGFEDGELQWSIGTG